MTIAEPDVTEARIAAAVSGDPEVWNGLYDELFEPVWRYVASRLRRDRAAVEDVVQDAFLSLVRALPGYREEGRFFGFVFAIVRQRVAAWYRSKGRTPAPLPPDLAEALATDDLPEDVLARKELRGMVRAALWTLAPRHRKVLLGRYEEALSFAELADREGISLGAAKSLAVRAKRALKEALGVEVGEAPGGET